MVSATRLDLIRPGLRAFGFHNRVRAALQRNRLSPQSIRAYYAQSTIRAYEEDAPAAIASWTKLRKPSKFLQRFAKMLKRGAYVLDYGCGIGTDMTWLIKKKFIVDGIDGTAAFVQQARRRCPKADIRCTLFEDALLHQNTYDAIWSQAALLHVPPSILKSQISILHKSLKPGGWLGISLAWGQSEVLTSNDWIPGRYVISYSKLQAEGFFKDWWIDQIKIISNDTRQGRWIQILAQPKKRSIR